MVPMSKPAAHTTLRLCRDCNDGRAEIMMHTKQPYGESGNQMTGCAQLETLAKNTACRLALHARRRVPTP